MAWNDRSDLDTAGWIGGALGDQLQKSGAVIRCDLIDFATLIGGCGADTYRFELGDGCDRASDQKSIRHLVEYGVLGAAKPSCRDEQLSALFGTSVFIGWIPN